MACFIVPAAEAVITTIAAKAIKSKEKKENNKLSFTHNCSEEKSKISFSEKLGWLNKMLWGGSALLAFEHIWHGEIIPEFPFLTAVKTGETAAMLKEMGTAGVLMAVSVTLVWCGMLLVSSVVEKRELKASDTVTEGA